VQVNVDENTTFSRGTNDREELPVNVYLFGCLGRVREFNRW
jgi:hypothetical protein